MNLPPPPVEIQLVDCVRMPTLRLSVGACASNYTAAKKIAADAGRSCTHCRGCPVGAERAGEPTDASSGRGAPLDKLTCARCGQPGRKIVARHLCVSCYNRQRELLGKKARRGKPPANLGPLMRGAAAVMTEGQCSDALSPPVLTGQEAMMTVSRAVPAGGLFGWSGKAFLLRKEASGA